MGCGCNKKSTVKVEYEVTFKNGSAKKSYKTSLEADAAAHRAGGGTVRAKQVR